MLLIHIEQTMKEHVLVLHIQIVSKVGFYNMCTHMHCTVGLCREVHQLSMTVLTKRKPISSLCYIEQYLHQYVSPHFEMDERCL